MDASTLILVFGIIRIVIGVSPVFAPRPSMRLLGFPLEHDNPTGRIMGRLFGVRDIGLGVMAIMALDYPEFLPFVCLFNAAHDAGDATAFAIPMIRGQEVGRGALVGLLVASSAIGAWLLAWWLL